MTSGVAPSSWFGYFLDTCWKFSGAFQLLLILPLLFELALERAKEAV
jgi:hypothetical protein